ncbi:MAG: GNAT family N-acetyltransferase [Candidatus Cloacimonetes bacterium]|nr:GNAT family N-acetyltransferase [Candidatus Cloacimonadota bacterium]MCF7814088.1 GNAT family N-acetyltransferase [Candidatus Cloacimonadota bacterium]MCF7867983.1 GNAT family N-acetyltransferase [Candidatus Cloacimonadota bacterium]MCF7883441.1 GNAT family N-acetyltransferase [Candidatus Cloacimonadota bacterium]
MKLLKFDNVDPFLEKTLPILREFELENNLIIGLAFILKNDPEIYPEKYLRAVENNGNIETIAVCTPPYKLLLYSKLKDPSQQLEPIAQDVKRNINIPGVLAANNTSRQFAKVWKKRENIDYSPGMSERIYKLDKIRFPKQPNGKMRLADENDFELLCKWAVAFHNEAVPDAPSKEIEKSITRKIERQQLAIWEDTIPVSLVGKFRPTINGISISMVYTPPEHRRKGYASALVAEFSRKLLDSGYKYITLFADLANPTSNSIYQRIGFEPVCDMQEYNFR